MGDGYGGMIEPAFHEGKRRFDGEWLVVQAWSCRDAQKPEDHDPWEEQGFAGRKLPFKPGKGRTMRGRVSIHRIDEEIGIRNRHFSRAIFRRISWSSSSEATWRALSTLK